MMPNVGSLDRIIRVALAISFAWLLGTNAVTGALVALLALVSFALIVTAIVGWCPLYSILNVSTNHSGPRAVR